MVQPTITGLESAGGAVTVFTAAACPHGVYWGRDEGVARQARGPKGPDELQEEEAARAAIVAFFRSHFDEPVHGRR